MIALIFIPQNFLDVKQETGTQDSELEFQGENSPKNTEADLIGGADELILL